MAWPAPVRRLRFALPAATSRASLGWPRRALGLYGPALAPFAPLAALVLFLVAVGIAQPSEGPPGQRAIVVADTDGAGVFLRNTPNLADRKAVVPEGTLMFEVGPSPDPRWRHVSVAPAGPVGWVPAQYVRVVP